jgi:DNA-binding Lrp family transcriptional regulator
MARISSNAEIVKIDKKDEKILALLSENARMAATSIAKKVRLSKDTVNYRIKRMQEQHVIEGFYPEFTFRKLGYEIYHVFLLIDEADKAKYDRLIGVLKAHKNTIILTEYSAMWDVDWVLVARNTSEFESILAEVSADFYGVILERSNYLVTEELRYRTVPYPSRVAKLIAQKKEAEHKPDEKDIAILRALSENSRVSTYKLSGKVGLSADAIGLRIKKLVEAGVITRFTVLPGLSALGYSEYTFCMQMKVFTGNSEVRLKGLMELHPNIISAVKVFGEWDVIVRISARNTAEFHKEVKEIKAIFSATVKNYCVLMACEEHVFNPLPPVIGA